MATFHQPPVSGSATVPPWPPEEATNTHADIDGDIVAYQVAYAGRNDSLKEVQKATSNKLKKIARGANADTLQIHMTDRDNSVNFRASVATIQPYKAGRATEKPKWLNHVREYMAQYWDGVMYSGIEADDAMAMNHYYSSFASPSYSDKEVPDAYLWSPTHQEKKHVICSTDKDLLTVRGAWVFNWDKDRTTYQSPLDAAGYFYKQCLTGDSVDNIKGLGVSREEGRIWGGDLLEFRMGPPSIGEASDWLWMIDQCESEEDMEKVVLEAYRERHLDLQFFSDELEPHPPLKTMLGLGPEISLLENARLLHMLRFPGDSWELR